MSEFIKLKIDHNRCLGVAKCGKCIEVCPVNIFFSGNQYPRVSDENEDECTLCNICLQSCNVDAITLEKTYER
jgi:NAD-dependent dihydropyrimidine dehydrogenase PreA subunit